HEDGVRQQLALYHVYYNFCLPHASLRVPLPQPLPTNGTGSAKTWRPRTPAMAAGLTDRGGTLRRGLLVRVPPWPQPVVREAERRGGRDAVRGREGRTCVRTAGFEGVTRGQRATEMP